MSVTLRPYRGGGWEVDITIRLPDGSQYRERKRASRFSKSAAHRWAEDRERYLLQHGPPKAKKEVPTLETFAPRFVDGHARANRHKPSGINAVESILRWHLVPGFGPKRKRYGGQLSRDDARAKVGAGYGDRNRLTESFRVGDGARLLARRL
jgi:hypothetical protein